MEIGLRVVVMVVQDFGRRILGRKRKTQFGNQGAAHLRRKVLESLAVSLFCPVNVQVVGVHGRHHRHLREQLEEGTVKLIRFRHHCRRFRGKQVGIVILGNTAQEGRAAFARCGQDVGGQGARRGLAMRARNRQAALPAGDFAQHARTLHQPVAVLPHENEFSHIVRNGGGINHQRTLLLGRNQIRPVFIVDGDAFGLQFFRQIRRSAVITAHLQSFKLIVPRNRTHPDSPDSDKIYPLVGRTFHLVR